MSKDHLEAARKRFLSGVGVPPVTEFVVDEFQREAIENITAGYDTLVVAPTGAGKTFIALEAIRSMLFQRKRSVYTTPLKALSNTKFADLKRRFEPEYNVGILTGDRKIESNADVVVATTEIYRNELYRGNDRYSLVVLDEVHFIADPQRGPVWEESIILTPSSTTLLMLSASISNYEEISAWISEIRGKPCKVVLKGVRPVELRFGFLHPDLGVLPLVDEGGGIVPEILTFYKDRKHERDGGRDKKRNFSPRSFKSAGGGRGRRGRR